MITIPEPAITISGIRTGKSQTIANLIADALGRNKKVLFVSAKMAALDVVHDRLKRLGLDRFCLEAHSTKAGKAKIIDELRRTLEAAEDLPHQQPRQRLDDLLRVRDDLNAYVRELHKSWPALQLTIYQAIGIIEKLRNAPNLRTPIRWKDPLDITRSQLTSALEALDDLASQAPVFDGRASHPWEGLAAADPTRPLNREALESDLLSVHEGFTKLRTELTAFSRIWAIPTEQLSLESLQPLATVLAGLATLDRLPVDWATRDMEQLRSRIALVNTAAANADELSMKRTQHREVLRVSPSQALKLLEPADTEFRSWSRVFRLAYWKWRALVRENLQAGAAAEMNSIRNYLVRIRRMLALDQWFVENAPSLTQDAGVPSSFTGDSLRSAAKRVRMTVDFRTALDAGHLPPPATSSSLTEDARRNATALSSLAQNTGLREAIQHIDALWPKGFVSGVPTAQAPVPAVLARCEGPLANVQKLHEWVVLQHTLLKCHDRGLTLFIEALGGISAKLARVAFERRFYVVWANAAVDASPALTAFSGARREDQISRFRALDEHLREASLGDCRVVASDPARRVASAHTIGTAGDVGTLRRELEKRKRFKPLRKLFAEIPAVLQALKPCFLMSPLSVSTFLRPGAMSFDLIVFDEASQLPTPEAIPAILRGSQVVVAGDKNQLPPTSFFDASVIFDDAAESDRSEELEPLESLLDDCVSIWPVFEQTHLRWHYRSKDERLVRFSNHYFYRDKPLITFPSPVRQSDTQGVSLLYVPDGVWDRGKSRTNRQEARAVARLIVEQLTKHPQRSLGTVAMNVNQREAIEESLDELVPQYPDIAPLLDRSANEPFFIKPLENVQGDERDTMIISVGYGKGPTGAISYNFGPLNQDAGWRRLNVLVTRARWQTMLVTSMRSHELSGINPNNRGASALRDFIAYAERQGELPADAPVVTDAETNDFEDAVVEALRQRNLQIDEQVGTSEYRIDLAIRDPRDTTKYILGIECDGASYHSARTARDRDLVRQLALRELGWRLYRVWSTDWFRDPDQAIAGVLRAVEMALKSPPEESVPAPTPTKPKPQQAAPTSSRRSEANKATAKAPPTSWRYPPGVPYEKYRCQGNRELLLNSDYVRMLADQITSLVEFEGPMHRDFLVERVKEINGIARAGSNVESNIRRAIDIAKRSHALRAAADFLSRDGAVCSEFRLPGAGVSRPVAWIPPEEIALAVLHIVEEQFGYQRDALPRAISGLFGFERTSAGAAETVGGVVDGLVERGLLRLSGPNVYLP